VRRLQQSQPCTFQIRCQQQEQRSLPFGVVLCLFRFAEGAENVEEKKAGQDKIDKNVVHPTPV